MRLQPANFSATQIRAFKKAYSNGEVNSEVMLNLFNFMELPPAYGLQLLTVPRLDPVHFNFTGNRPYEMQVVSNGECFAILSHQRLPKSQRDMPAINVARMEVITSAALPFLALSQPSERQLRELHADFIVWNVANFNKIKDTWPQDAVDFAMSLTDRHPQEQGDARERLLAGEDARVVMKEWIEQGAMNATLQKASPIPRRPGV